MSRETWASMLGVNPYRVEPGADLGPPTGTLLGRIMEDVIIPFPGQLLLQERARQVLSSASLTGFELWREQLVAAAPGESRSCASDDAHDSAEPPIDLDREAAITELWEVFVTGRAWRPGRSEESPRLCNLCGRRGFPDPKNLTVDAARWDGSDFLNLDMNPNIVIVTRRVRDLFEANKISNCVFIPV